MQMRLAEESTLEKALSSVQKKLPQKADYRLCDFLIISENTSEELLSAYESIVLESGRGRAAAKASILAVSVEELEKQLEAAEGLPDRLLNELKQESGRMPAPVPASGWNVLAAAYRYKMRSFPLPEQVFSGKGSSASSWTPSRRQ